MRVWTFLLGELRLTGGSVFEDSKRGSQRVG
jgi:hypothetical protein